MKNVIGIDPGLASLGWGIVQYNEEAPSNTIEYVAHGVINTSSDTELPYRLLSLEANFDKIMKRYAIVELAYEYQFFVKNVTSGLPVAHALGVILLYSAKNSVKVTCFTPLDVKKQITGNARSSKNTVNKHVCLPLRIDEIYPHHAADALAVAVTHILKKQGETVKQTLEYQGTVH